MDGIKDQIIKRLTKALTANPQLFAEMLIDSRGDMTVFILEFRKNIVDELKIESGRKKSE